MADDMQDPGESASLEARAAYAKWRMERRQEDRGERPSEEEPQQQPDTSTPAMKDPGEGASLEARAEYAKFNMQRRQTERAAQTPGPTPSDTTEEVAGPGGPSPGVQPTQGVASVAARPQDSMVAQAPAMAAAQPAQPQQQAQAPKANPDGSPTDPFARAQWTAQKEDRSKQLDPSFDWNSIGGKSQGASGASGGADVQNQILIELQKQTDLLQSLLTQSGNNTATFS